MNSKEDDSTFIHRCLLSNQSLVATLAPGNLCTYDDLPLIFDLVQTASPFVFLPIQIVS